MTFNEAAEREAYEAFNKRHESDFLDDDNMSRYERGLKVWLAAKKEAAEQIEMVPAIPPEGYKGSQGDWLTALIKRDLWDGEGWHGDIEIPSDVWWEILDECES